MIEANGKKIAVVVYSAGRAEALQTTRWLTDKRCYLCVPKSEKALYEAKAPLPILPHPDDINRLFLKIRWVHEYFKDADLVVKVDDDIPYIRDNGAYYRQDKDIGLKSKLSQEDFFLVMSNMLEMSRYLGTHLFGFGSDNVFSYYDATKRFSFKFAFDGSIMGYLPEEKIKVDDSILVRNEYDLQLQCLYHYKLMLIDHRYRQIQAEMHKQSGGMSVYRNTETIALSIDRLKRKWGGAIKIVMSKGRPAIRFRV